jgi:amino acid permease
MPSLKDSSDGFNLLAEDHQNSASFLSCVLGLVNTIIGAGILATPYAFAKAGWVFGTLLLITCAGLSLLGLRMLSTCACNTERPSSFFNVAAVTVPSYSSMIDIAVVLNSLGISVAYLEIIGDMATSLMADVSAPQILRNRSVCISIGFAVGASLAMLPRLSSLKFTSGVSTGVILMILLMIVAGACDYPLVVHACDASVDKSYCYGDFYYFISDIDTLRYIPVFIFSFSCQQNTFAVVNELARPTRSRINNVFNAAIGISLSVYVIVAFCGYYTFGNAVTSDILLMYPGKSIAIKYLDDV